MSDSGGLVGRLQGEPATDCDCPRARHDHGTYLCYEVHRCRCFPCRVAWALARQEYRAGRSYATVPRFVPRVGTNRRIEALLALGWRHSDMTARLAELGDTNATDTAQLIRRPGPFVWAATAQAVADLYDQLSMTPGPSQRNRDRARKRGYVPPLAWDDDTIDDPEATPQHDVQGPPELAPCGTLAAHRRHQRRGERVDEACRKANARREDAA